MVLPFLNHAPWYSGFAQTKSPIFASHIHHHTSSSSIFSFKRTVPFPISDNHTSSSTLSLSLASITSMSTDPSGRRSYVCSLLPIAPIVFLLIIVASVFIAPDYTEKLSGWKVVVARSPKFNNCESRCRPPGSEALPQGIVATTSDLDLRPLWLPREKLERFYGEYDRPKNKSLFSVAAGIRQKGLVNSLVKKFLSCGFVVMIFHYDGNVDEWKEFEWNNLVIHVSAINQTKWWFAKRFLHPDIIGEYNYVFLWDEDLGVENFNPKRYLSIIKNEGLEISQPGLDAEKSEVHHQITARGRKSNVHRRTYKPSGAGIGCDDSSTSPPCTGWIEVMAPVFSRAAWRCIWYMIQGDRTKKVGVVDAEYIVHYGLPTLGGVYENKTISPSPAPSNTGSISSTPTSAPHPDDHRVDVRRQSYFELKIFNERWRKAAEGECWINPYKQPAA